MLLRLSYMVHVEVHVNAIEVELYVHVAVHVNAIEVELYGACGGSCECY